MDSSETSMRRKLKDFLSCPICYEAFTAPKTLSCLHTFCLSCLDGYLQKCGTGARKPGKGGKVTCPVCREEVALPGSGKGAADIRTNFFVESLCAELQASGDGSEDGAAEGAVQRRPPSCQSCEAGVGAPPAVGRCQQCEEYLCESCAAVHRAHKLTRTHTIEPLQEDSLKASDDVPLVPSSSLCAAHNQHYQLICQDCQGSRPLCLQCFLLDHNGHRVCDLTAAAKRARDSLQMQLDLVKELHSRDEEALESAEKKRQALEDSYKTAYQGLNEKRKNLQSAIDRFTSNTKRETDSLYSSQLKEVQMSIDELQMKVGCEKSVLDYGATLIEHASDSCIILGQDKIEERLSQLRNKFTKSTEPCQASISFGFFPGKAVSMSDLIGVTVFGDQKVLEEATRRENSPSKNNVPLKSQGTQTECPVEDKATSCSLWSVTDPCRGSSLTRAGDYWCEYDFLLEVASEVVNRQKEQFVTAVHRPERNIQLRYILKKQPRDTSHEQAEAGGSAGVIWYFCLMDDIALRLVNRPGMGKDLCPGSYFKLYRPHVQRRLAQEADEQDIFTVLHSEDLEYLMVHRKLKDVLPHVLRTVRSIHPIL